MSRRDFLCEHLFFELRNRSFAQCGQTHFEVAFLFIFVCFILQSGLLAILYSYMEVFFKFDMHLTGFVKVCFLNSKPRSKTRYRLNRLLYELVLKIFATLCQQLGTHSTYILKQHNNSCGGYLLSYASILPSPISLLNDSWQENTQYA